MKVEEINKLAQKYHTPGEKINERWNSIYQAECIRINRKHLEGEIIKKYDVLRKVNKEVKRSTLLTQVAKGEYKNQHKDMRDADKNQG